MKIGLIGAGAWGWNVCKNLQALGVLHGVADMIEANRSRVLDEFPDIPVYTDHCALLKSGCDAIAIATPAHTHYALGIEVIKRGLDVFIEKPMTLSVEDADSLIACASQNERILMTGHLLLYQPAVTFIKEYLESGRLGKIYSLHQRRAKLGRARSVENVLWSFGVHDVAVLLYLVGVAPDGIQISGHSGLQAEIEDDVYLHMVFPNGIKAHLHNSWLWPRVERGLIVVGEKAILEYDEINQRVLLHHKTIDDDLNNVDQGEEELFRGSGQPLELELGHFIDCCRTRKYPISDGGNGRDVVSVLAQAESLLKETR